MNNRKKDLKRTYKETHTPMGVYQIRNLVNNKVLIGTAMNLPGILNSHRLQLGAGRYPNKALQADWNEYGPESFAFEVLDELAATEGPGHDYREDLAFLEDLWLEKIEPYEDRGYNKKKQGKDEKLRQIALNRLAKS
jgi:hypothetical protein